MILALGAEIIHRRKHVQGAPVNKLSIALLRVFAERRACLARINPADNAVPNRRSAILSLKTKTTRTRAV
jgi:hypothetical protein